MQYAEWKETLKDSDLQDQFPFLADITEDRFVKTNGGELYLIVPCDEDASVTVRQWKVEESNNFEGAAGEILYQSNSGDPILIQGNESEIMPNMELTIETKTGATLHYIPFMSMENGFLQGASGVWDMNLTYMDEETLLDYVPYTERALPPELLTGDWAGRQILLTENKGYVQCGLTLKPGGIADYGYGMEDEAYSNFYKGDWWYVPYENEPNRGTVFLDLEKLPEESTGDGPDRIIGEYFFSEGFWDGEKDLFYVTKMTGDDLIPDSYYDSIEVVQSVG